MKKIIAVTGLSGMIGSKFEHKSIDKYEFVNLDLSTGVDIINYEQIKTATNNANLSAILHLAAFTNVSAAHEQRGDRQGACYKVNVLGTQNIVNLAQEMDIHLLHVSTDFVFSGKKETEYTEVDQPDPIEWYGETKYLAEQVVAQYHKGCIARITYPYQSHPSRPDFLALMREKMSKNELAPAFSDHIINPTLVDDIVMAFDRLLKSRAHGIYHVTGGEYLSDYQIALLVKAKFGYQLEIKEGSLTEYIKTAPRPYQMRLQTSSQKIQSEFGIKMRGFSEGLEEISD